MKKQTSTTLHSAATKTPTTKDVVKRVQSRTAGDNGGQQKDWVRRLQSTADKREHADQKDAATVKRWPRAG
ncbi:hypothetical protein IFU01_18065 [Oxalobacteraceae sp. CFBP 8763]|nr:hypothetical protein [Oxalobacteraceae sp. CFBP 8763]